MGDEMKTYHQAMDVSKLNQHFRDQREALKRREKAEEALIQLAAAPPPAKEKRRLEVERENIRLKALAGKTIEDTVNAITSVFPEMPAHVLQAGMMHAKGKTWEAIIKVAKRSRSTVSKYIQQFYKTTGWPQTDRRMGMGKKHHIDEARDKATEQNEHPEHPRTLPKNIGQ